MDVAFLPIGGTYTMDIDEAVEAALLIEPRLAVPMHTRQEADPHEFVRKLERRSAGIQAIAPGIGEPIAIAGAGGPGTPDAGGRWTWLSGDLGQQACSSTNRRLPRHPTPKRVKLGPG